MQATHRLTLLLLGILGAFHWACGPESEPDGEGERISGEVLVSAAASLTDAFGEIEAAFEVANPGLDVALNLAGSSALRAQIFEGAPVDVFASADPTIMAQLSESGELAEDALVFARNRLTIAVPRGNPAGVAGLTDFARSELLLGLCAESVPCGGLARAVLSQASVDPSVDTEEPDVRALLTKVAVRELDGAITYVTDVAAAGGEVEGIEIAEDDNVVAEYPIAVLAAAPNPGGARAFVRFVLSTEGRAILARHGFLSP